MRTLLALTFLIAFAAGTARAQDKIIVIDEHGKVSEIDIGAAPAVPKAKDKSTAPAPSLRRTPPAEPAPEPAPVTKPAPDAE